MPRDITISKERTTEDTTLPKNGQQNTVQRTNKEKKKKKKNDTRKERHKQVSKLDFNVLSAALGQVTSGR